MRVERNGNPRLPLYMGTHERKLHLRHPHPATQLVCRPCRLPMGCCMTGYATDLLVIGGGGLLLLLSLAVLIGRVNAGARSGAWRRIADARRLQHERERKLFDCLSSRQCRDCPTWQHLRDRHGDEA